MKKKYFIALGKLIIFENNPFVQPWKSLSSLGKTRIQKSPRSSGGRRGRFLSSKHTSAGKCMAVINIALGVKKYSIIIFFPPPNFPPPPPSHLSPEFIIKKRRNLHPYKFPKRLFFSAKNTHRERDESTLRLNFFRYHLPFFLYL